jgi:hypothetical protein
MSKWQSGLRKALGFRFKEETTDFPTPKKLLWRVSQLWNKLFLGTLVGGINVQVVVWYLGKIVVSSSVGSINPYS